VDCRRAEARVLWPLLALFWVGNIGATMAQVYLRQTVQGSFPSMFDLMRWVLPMYVAWLAGAPLIVLVLSRRFSFQRGSRLASAMVHLLASVAIAAAAIAGDALGVMLREPAREFTTVYENLARGWLLWVVFTYWFFLAVLLAVRHSVMAGTRELRATQMETAVATAQLAALKTQLHPHFLFNALNSVSSLIAEDPRAAQKMIARLGELLRTTLADGGSGDSTLRRELELVDAYVAIEKVRFGDRLRVMVECEDDVLAARVPTLLLLPLVENAILHGIQPTLRGGTVHVRARREGERVRIEVIDDGAGVKTANGESPERIGLGNTRQRLEKRFGQDQDFRISAHVPSGTRVDITIPWHAAPAERMHVATA
jgi:signal transduction histidine kinase